MHVLEGAIKNEDVLNPLVLAPCDNHTLQLSSLLL